MRDQHREQYAEGFDCGLATLQRMRGCTASAQAFTVRNNFRDYFLSDAGKLPWQ